MKEGTKEEQNCYTFLVMMYFIIMIHVFRALENECLWNQTS